MVSEPFLEAVPQVHILLVIWVLDGGGCSGAVDGGPFFITTFVTSVITASFGISKFLKSGPCRFIKSFGTLSYFLLFLNIAATIVAKGFFVVASFGPPDHGHSYGGVNLLFGLFCYLPQLAMVSIYTVAHLLADWVQLT